MTCLVPAHDLVPLNPEKDGYAELVNRYAAAACAVCRLPLSKPWLRPQVTVTEVAGSFDGPKESS